MNQSLFNDYCNSDSCRETMRRCRLVTYAIFMPIHAVLAPVGLIFLLIALIAQAKRQRAYIYQILVVANECLYDVFGSMYLLFMGLFSDMPWFRRSYVLMWYTSHLGTVLPNVFYTNVLLMSVVTAVDRLTAVRKPVVHRRLNHKRLQIAVTLLGLVISIGTSLFDCFRYNLNETSDGYKTVIDEEYTGSDLAIGLTHLCSAIRLGIGVILIATNVVLVGAYKQFNRNFELFTLKTNCIKKRLDERTLTMLTVCQCSKASVTVILFTLYYAMEYSSLRTCECLMKIIGRTIDDLMLTVELIAIFICIGCSRQCKVWLRQAVRWFNKKLGVVSNRNVVSTTNVASAGNARKE